MNCFHIERKFFTWTEEVIFINLIHEMLSTTLPKKLAKYIIIRDIHCKLIVSSLQLLEYFFQIIHTVIRYNKPIDVIFGTIYIISISNLIAV